MGSISNNISSDRAGISDIDSSSDLASNSDMASSSNTGSGNNTKDAWTSTTEDNIIAPDPAPVHNPERRARPPRHERSSNLYSIILVIFRSLKFMESTINKVHEDMTNYLREQASTVRMDFPGVYSYQEPAAIALYVVHNEVINKCAHCNLNTEFVCAMCRQGPYCSSFCLQKHWGSHEPHCNIMRLATLYAASYGRMRK